MPFLSVASGHFQAMLQNVNALEFASERLRGLKSLILEAISFNTAALQHATLELRCLEPSWVSGSWLGTRVDRGLDEWMGFSAKQDVFTWTFKGVPIKP